jgi:hypothetical protein
MTQGVGVEPSCSGEFGLGIEEAGHDHSHNEVSLRAWVGVNEALEAAASECPQDRGDMPVGPRTHDVKGIVELRDGDTTVQQGLEAFDEFRRPLGEIGQGAFANFAPLTERFSEQDSWGGVAVGYAFDIHEHRIYQYTLNTSRISL